MKPEKWHICSNFMWCSNENCKHRMPHKRKPLERGPCSNNWSDRRGYCHEFGSAKCLSIKEPTPADIHVMDEARHATFETDVSQKLKISRACMYAHLRRYNWRTSAMKLLEKMEAMKQA